METASRNRSRTALQQLSRWRPWLLLLLLRTSAAQSEPFVMSRSECVAALLEGDLNFDSKLSVAEYVRITLRLSDFPQCPETRIIQDPAFLALFESLSCECRKYDHGFEDVRCCEEDGRSVVFPSYQYPDEYMDTICTSFETVINNACLEVVPTGAPLTEAPSGAPVTDVPSSAPVTDVPSSAPVTGTPTVAPVTAPSVAPSSPTSSAPSALASATPTSFVEPPSPAPIVFTESVPTAAPITPPTAAPAKQTLAPIASTPTGAPTDFPTSQTIEIPTVREIIPPPDDGRSSTGRIVGIAGGATFLSLLAVGLIFRRRMNRNDDTSRQVVQHKFLPDTGSDSSLVPLADLEANLKESITHESTPPSSPEAPPPLEGKGMQLFRVNRLPFPPETDSDNVNSSSAADSSILSSVSSSGWDDTTDSSLDASSMDDALSSEQFGDESDSQYTESSEEEDDDDLAFESATEDDESL